MFRYINTLCMWYDADRAFPARFSLPTRGTPLLSFHLGSISSELHRTFLSWLHFTVVLGGLAVGLLNFGDNVRSSAHFLSHFLIMKHLYGVGRSNKRSNVLPRRYVLLRYSCDIGRMSLRTFLTCPICDSVGGDALRSIHVPLEGRCDS
jgi:hypothetical protein